MKSVRFVCVFSVVSLASALTMCPFSSSLMCIEATRGTTSDLRGGKGLRKGFSLPLQSMRRQLLPSAVSLA